MKNARQPIILMILTLMLLQKKRRSPLGITVEQTAVVLEGRYLTCAFTVEHVGDSDRKHDWTVRSNKVCGLFSGMSAVPLSKL
jgi:hypothetical protein